MKLFRHILAITFTCFTIVISGFAQEQETTISGIFKNKIDGEAVLLTSNYYFPYRNGIDSKSDTLKIIGDAFKFNVAVENPNAYVTLILPNPLDSRKLFLNLYLIEQGSNVLIQIKNDQLAFIGKGAVLFECQYRMNLVPKNYMIKSIEESERLRNDRGYYGYYRFLNDKRDSLYGVKLKILDSYKSRLSEESYQRLYTDYKSENIYEYFQTAFGSSFSNMQTESKNAFLMYYKDNLLKVKPDNYYPAQLELSKYYSSAVLAKLRSDTKYFISDFVYKSPGIDSLVFERLLNGYSGELQEKLLIDNITQLSFGHDPEYVTSYWESSDKFIRTPALRKIFSGYTQRLKGVQAYRFSLPGTAGNIVRLDDFKERLLVIDFWFKGCAQCIKLEKQMKIIRETFKDSKNIAFLSVNVDAKKSNWLDGVRSGLYAGKESINVSTYGLGAQHPFFKYYDYSGCPQMLIIGKDQRVVMANPEKPMFEKDRDSFIDLLKRLTL